MEREEAPIPWRERRRPLNFGRDQKDHAAKAIADGLPRRYGRVAAATLLLSRGADVDRTNRNGCSPLWMACLKDHVGAALLCLDRGGAEVDRARHNGITPLHMACWNGHIASARILLDHGARVDLKDDHGWSSLHSASYQGHVDAARLCLEHGSWIHRTDFDGWTAYDFARERGHAAMAAWLAQIQLVGWTRHFSEPRYKLVVLRALSARGDARRKRADLGKEQLLDFLFPGDQPRRRARRNQPRLPDELFAIIARYYRGGGL